MTGFRRIGVIGAGAWGTALANAGARAGCEVALWGRPGPNMTALIETRQNAAYLPGVPLEAGVTPVADLVRAARCDAVLLVVPAQAMRGMVLEIASHIAPGTPLVSCAKGLERDTLAFMSAVIADVVPSARPCVLSGPSFAADVGRGLPTAVTLAAEDGHLAEELALALVSPAFRLYHTDDVTGVEIGGAAKNVLAIASGIAAGRGLGASAGAALIARGFAELRRLGAALAARPETLMGLSGLGDLVLTATSAQSRNYMLGQAIGAGEALPGKLAEGAFTAEALAALARKHDVDMPIVQAVCDVLGGTRTVDEAMTGLLTRPIRAEDE